MVFTWFKRNSLQQLKDKVKDDNNNNRNSGVFWKFNVEYKLFPQTYHTIKHKKYDDIYILFLCLMIFTCYVMSLYGYLIRSYPVCVANICVMLNNKAILFLG